ncbi:MAG: hypothetical protein HOW73_20365 [Polyangiaceae bacterium]|nr:hypothetical protein [Polyangiaceae bacterium]
MNFLFYFLDRGRYWIANQHIAIRATRRRKLKHVGFPNVEPERRRAPEQSRRRLRARSGWEREHKTYAFTTSLGERVVQRNYVDFVEAKWPRCRWYFGRKEDAVFAKVDGELVAIVMPVRT